ncbi:MAG: 7-carboxy-7-deazaguanine synthase QueE [bacterium]
MTEAARAKLVEIFSSLQGEGTRVGERMSFVRFEACDLKCRWCDTPESFSPHAKFRVEEVPFSGEWREYSNPVSGKEIEKWLSLFSDTWVSLTGGEPLQQVEFLEEWLPSASKKSDFLLETNGVLPEALRRVLPYVRLVSMDMKLPSSAKTGEFWKEHEEFLRIAVKAPECSVKLVVTEETLEEEFERALNLVKKVEETIPVILQPASATKSFKGGLSLSRLGRFSEIARSALKGVRVIPQTHKMLGVS